jgi:hypothetical protein
MKYLKKFEAKFDQRTGYQTTNQEWLDWEDKVEKIKERLSVLSKKLDDDLIKIEETCSNIINNLFDTGEVTHMGILGDWANYIERTPIFQQANKKSNDSYNKWKKEQDARDNEWKKEQDAKDEYYRKQFPNIYGWKDYLKKENKEEKSVPSWFHIIENLKNKIRSFRSEMFWKEFCKDPIAVKLPSEIKNISSKFEMLEASLTEMPEKFATLIQKNIPENFEENIKEIEKLREEYYELLEVQPTHWVK